MQSYFKTKSFQKKEIKRLNLDTDRGINLHRFSDFKFKGGSLIMSKNALKEYKDEDEQ